MGHLVFEFFFYLGGLENTPNRFKYPVTGKYLLYLKGSSQNFEMRA